MWKELNHMPAKQGSETNVEIQRTDKKRFKSGLERSHMPLT